MFSKTEIGIDLGTANLLIHSTKGIILNEPSIVAVDNITNKVVAVGNDAKNMVGRTPKNISSIRPLKEGVIADYDITTEMLKYLLKKERKKIRDSLKKQTINNYTPSSSTKIKHKAIK